MKIHKSTKFNKALIVGTVVVLALIAVVVFAYFNKLGPFASKVSTESSDINFGPATDDEIKAGQDTKQQTVDQDEAKANSGSDPSPAPTPDPAGGKSTVSMSITKSDSSNGTLIIRTSIQTVSSAGTCTLSMTGPNGKTYTASSKVQALPSSSTCQGFDLPLSSLSSGSWKIVINFENDTVKASVTETKTL